MREWHPLGHTRAPRYIQGKPGVVVRLDGVFSVPDVEYHCDAQRMEPTYSVRFEAVDLWGSPGDPVHVDLWESYLEPEEATSMGDAHHHPPPTTPVEDRVVALESLLVEKGIIDPAALDTVVEYYEHGVGP